LAAASVPLPPSFFRSVYFYVGDLSVELVELVFGVAVGGFLFFIEDGFDAELMEQL